MNKFLFNMLRWLPVFFGAVIMLTEHPVLSFLFLYVALALYICNRFIRSEEIGWPRLKPRTDSYVLGTVGGFIFPFGIIMLVSSRSGRKSLAEHFGVLVKNKYYYLRTPIVLTQIEEGESK